MSNSESKNINKVILNYSAKTLLVLVVFSLIGALVFAFIYPKKIATFSYNQGWRVLAEHYYIKEYEKNENIDNLYNVVIISATNNSHENIVKYYEKLSNNNDYNSLIDSVNQNTENYILQRPYNINTLSLLLNEDNYLKNKYISALIETEGLEKTLAYAVENSSENLSGLNNQNNYLFGGLITKNTLLERSVMTGVTTKTENQNSVIENVSNRFYKLYNFIVDGNQKLMNEELSIIENAYLIKSKDILKQMAFNLTEFNEFYEELGILHNQNVYSNAQILNMLTTAI